MRLSVPTRSRCGGFSLVELIISLLLTLVVLGAGVAVFSGALSTRERESGRTDAITSAQAALSVMSREIGNTGYGLEDNGLVYYDCDADAIHFRANIVNSGTGNNTISAKGEDVMYYFDDTSNSVVRYDAVTGETSGIINRVSDVDFVFHNYDDSGTFTSGTVAAANTARVTLTLKIFLPDVEGQPSGRIEQVKSDITLRNSPYMLGQY